MLRMTCTPSLKQWHGSSSVQELALLADDHHAALVREALSWSRKGYLWDDPPQGSPVLLMQLLRRLSAAQLPAGVEAGSLAVQAHACGGLRGYELGKACSRRSGAAGCLRRCGASGQCRCADQTRRPAPQHMFCEAPVHVPLGHTRSSPLLWRSIRRRIVTKSLQHGLRS